MIGIIAGTVRMDSSKRRLSVRERKPTLRLKESKSDVGLLTYGPRNTSKELHVNRLDCKKEINKSLEYKERDSGLQAKPAFNISAKERKHCQTRNRFKEEVKNDKDDKEKELISPDITNKPVRAKYSGRMVKLKKDKVVQASMESYRELETGYKRETKLGRPGKFEMMLTDRPRIAKRESTQVRITGIKSNEKSGKAMQTDHKKKCNVSNKLTRNSNNLKEIVNTKQDVSNNDERIESCKNISHGDFVKADKPANHLLKEDGSCVEMDDSNTSTNSVKNESVFVKLSIEGIDTQGSVRLEELDSNDQSEAKFDCKEEINEDVNKVENMDNDIDAEIKIEFDEFAEAAELEDEVKMSKSLECPVCSKALSSKCNLLKHMALHKADKPYQCEICGRSFALQSYLTIHSVVHSRKRVHKCEKCGKAFLRRCNLNTHKQTHAVGKAYSCVTCDKKFKTKLGLDNHMRDHVNGAKFQCSHCEKSFNQETYLKRHISIHKGEKPFKCNICGKAFPYNQSLQEHMRIHTGEKPDVCDKCGKGFNNKRQLKAHMKYHTTITDFSCEECHLFYDSQQSLNKHITISHNRKHECLYCQHSFISKKNLRTHMSSNHKDAVKSSRKIPPMDLAKAKKVECTICNRVFFNRYVLSKHLMSKHDLSEKDMKEMLQIRKKAVSKKQVEKLSESDVKDISNLLEPNEGFRVYYKDDEMAVYVKGVDALDSRLKGNPDGNLINIANASNQSVQFIVDENGKETNRGIQFVVDENGKGRIGDVVEESQSQFMNAGGDAGQPQSGGLIQTIPAGSEQVYVPSGDSKNVDSANFEGMDCSDSQNYYVVLTDSNDTNGGSASDNKVLVQSEMQSMGDGDTEQVVLILNEGDTGSNIVFENGEEYEIVEGGSDLIQQGFDDVEYEVVATCPVTDGGEKNYLDAQKEISTEGYTEMVVNQNDHAGQNLPILDLLHSQNASKLTKNYYQTQEDVNQIQESITTRQESEMDVRHASRMKAEYESAGIQRNVTDMNNAKDGLEEIAEFKSDPTGNIVEVAETMDSDTYNSTAEASVYSSIAVVRNDEQSMPVENIPSDTRIGLDSVKEILPKTNSVHDFEKFENAIKSKSGDFHNQDDYNDFIDKMIETLQKAKSKD